jgi:hypothetical protein
VTNGPKLTPKVDIKALNDIAIYQLFNWPCENCSFRVSLRSGQANGGFTRCSFFWINRGRRKTIFLLEFTVSLLMYLQLSPSQPHRYWPS